MIIKRNTKQLLETTADLWRIGQGDQHWNDWNDNDYRPEMPGGFQGQVNVQPAPAVAGDFASTNPRATFDAGPGGLVVGAAGCSVGLFAWVTPPVDQDGTNQIALNSGYGNVAGFVHREQQALITTFLSDATQTLPKGFGITLMTQGDFWAVNNGTGPALVGQKAYALFGTGQAVFAAASAPPTATVTGSIGAQSLTFNGSITGDVLTVTAMGTGSIATGLVVGSILSGGTGVVANTQIVQQLTGVTGSVGTYLVNYPEQTVASALLTATYGLLTVASVANGTLVLGAVLSGTAGGGVTTQTTITQFGTGAGGSGTYYVNLTQTVAVGSVITANVGVETKWYAASNALAGELVKITSWVGAFG